MTTKLTTKTTTKLTTKLTPKTNDERKKERKASRIQESTRTGSRSINRPTYTSRENKESIGVTGTESPKVSRSPTKFDYLGVASNAQKEGINVQEILQAKGINELLEKEQAKRGISDFIKAMWRYIDPSVYIPNWHIDAICEHLEAVSRGEIRKLVINIPPRHMKSIGVAIAWPSWTWIDFPQKQFLFASYSQSLSIRDSVKCRRILDCPLYQRWFGDSFKLLPDQNMKQRYDNNQGGYRIATSVDGALTGEGGDIIVIDDPHNVKEAESETVRTACLSWWDEAMSTRLNNPKTGAYVIIQQRVHEKDLTGHVLAQQQKDWTHLMLPAEYDPSRKCFTDLGFQDPRTKAGELLWKERYGRPEVDDIKIRLGPYGTAGQLQQLPAPREGGMLERGWFEIVNRAPAHARRVRWWDMAATEKKSQKSSPDYTAGAKLALGDDGIIYIEDIRQVRKSPRKIEKLIKQTAQLDDSNFSSIKKRVNIWMEQEPGASGKIVIDSYLRKVLSGFPFRGECSTGSKSEYVNLLAAGAEGGIIKLVKGPWNEAFLKEAEMFPNGAHDDMVDAVSKGYCKLTVKKKRAGTL